MTQIIEIADVNGLGPCLKDGCVHFTNHKTSVCDKHRTGQCKRCKVSWTARTYPPTYCGPCSTKIKSKRKHAGGE
jgi:hypothetical protein